ncbi:MAG TPA: ABC transporter permease [Puia sp.]|nr:ABC transporter permease [Puia sp.]
MLRNYLLLAIKNFRKHQLFSVVNVLGLTIGITCCLMIFLFVQHEFSVDRWHANGDRIYRAVRVNELEANDKKQDIAWLSPPYAGALLNDYPNAIQKAVRIRPDNDLITYNQVAFNEKKVFLADSNFFQFFSFPLVKGDPATVLSDPTSIVMTASTAKKYFGDADPIGKVVEMNEHIRLKVTGIAADVPSNSTLDFDMVMPLSYFRHDYWMNQWPANSVYTYVRLAPGVDAGQLTKRLPAFMDKYLGKFYRENGFKMSLALRPLKDIYFSSDRADNVKHGSRKMVYVFMSIAVLILVIACINFMNLATARADDRSKEVGLRKVMGAVRRQLAGQFFLESILFATLATVCAVILLQLLMPVYTSFLGYQLPSYFGNVWFYFFLAGIILVAGVFAGSYPALLLSSFTPIESLKGRLKAGTRGVFFRKALVVFQFGISVLLIASVAIVMKQMRYVRNTDLGFDKGWEMIVRIDNNSIYDNMNRFKSAVQADAGVASVSLMSGEPGGFHDSYGFESGARPGDKLSMHTEFADFEYVKTLGLKIIAGRDLSSQFPTDTDKAVLINRSAATMLGLSPEKAVGTSIRNLSADSLPRTVAGVVEDYHYSSLKEMIGPLVISPKKGDRRLALIKLKSGGDLQQTVDRIKKVYGAYASGYPFEYSFLDERFDGLYRSEGKQETLLTIFSTIAISVACLGLFGLACYTAVKRKKEIGVRKVLGSSVENIVLLLSKDLLSPVLIGTAIALPVAYYVTRQWLQGFAYRVTPGWWLFAAAALVGIVIALLTVSVQAVRAAVANPTKALRSE